MSVLWAGQKEMQNSYPGASLMWPDPILHRQKGSGTWL